MRILIMAAAAALLLMTGAARAAEGTALITGSNRGIGFEFTRQLAESGWNVIATTRNPAGATELEKLADEQPNITIEQLDVTSDTDIAALKEKYRDTPIDLLLLNAAKGPEQPGATAPLARQDMNRAAIYFDVNAVGPMKVTQAFMDNVKAGERKLIIAVSSDSGSFVAGSQLPILYHYKASKAALNMYFHTLAFETGRRGVTVVMLHPGIVATNEQLARFPNAMQPEDSVAQMLETIGKLSIDDNGAFIDYKGDPMPW